MSILEKSNFDHLHEGERGYVIGGGASIVSLINNGFDFCLLDNEITIAVNQAYKLGNPKYITSVDTGFLGRNKGKFPPHPALRFLLPKQVIKTSECGNRIVTLQKQEGDCPFPTFLTDPLPNIPNSGAFGILLAYLLGLNPIYLIGFDGVKIEGDTHFHNDYGNWKLNDGQVAAMISHSRRVIEVLFERGITIYSCSSVSLLNDILEFVDLNEVING